MVGAGWADMEAEFKAGAEAGWQSRLWWRDDDAIEPTAPLKRLLELQRQSAQPLALAVIPGLATAGLADLLNERMATVPGLHVLQHGYRHIDHAAPGQKKSEFPEHRIVHEMLADVSLGHEGLKVMFRAQALPVFVPPWNRIAEVLLPRLQNAFLGGYSGFGPTPDLSGHGLNAQNCHLDIINWRGGRGFVGDEAALQQLIAELRGRRLAASTEPVGLLTHHLVHDEAAWTFLDRLFELSGKFRHAHWLSATELFNLQK